MTCWLHEGAEGKAGPCKLGLQFKNMIVICSFFCFLASGLILRMHRYANYIYVYIYIYVKLLTESFPGVHQYLVPQKRFVLSGEQTKRFLHFSQSHEREKTLLRKPAAFLPLLAW